jgi:hypothetical protein
MCIIKDHFQVKIAQIVHIFMIRKVGSCLGSGTNIPAGSEQIQIHSTNAKANLTFENFANLVSKQKKRSGIVYYKAALDIHTYSKRNLEPALRIHDMSVRIRHRSADPCLFFKDPDHVFSSLTFTAPTKNYLKKYFCLLLF